MKKQKNHFLKVLLISTRKSVKSIYKQYNYLWVSNIKNKVFIRTNIRELLRWCYFRYSEYWE